MLYVFGDSFAASYGEGLETHLTEQYFDKNEKAWHQQVSESMDEDLINKAISGSGPQTAMKSYIKLIESMTITSNDFVVIVLSNPYRLPMKWPGDEHGTTITGSCLYDEYLIRVGLNTGDPVLSDYPLSRDKLYCLDEIYTNMRYEFALMNIKNLHLINFLANKFKIKTIAFQCFEPDETNEEIVLNKEIYGIEKNKYFYSYPTPLMKISIDEWVGDSYSGGFTNHLSPYAHKTLANIIINFFTGTNLSEEFVKNKFSDGPTLSEPVFIYE
tara:strand:- start:312 stop:1124 length:813 start_codon:yes stop_codon:yes gene_type:complete